jgi:type IV pilus assembly protein PilF
MRLRSRPLGGRPETRVGRRRKRTHSVCQLGGRPKRVGYRRKRIRGIRQLAGAHSGRLALAMLACLVLGTGGCASAPSVADQRIARARRNVGIDYLAKGRTPHAIRELQSAQKLAPDDPVTIHWLGEGYRRHGLLDKALEYFLRSIELDPEAQEVRLNLAGLYIQRKLYPEAIEQCQALIDDPTFASPWQAYTNRGWAELQLGELDAAHASLQEALAFRRTYWPARLNLGILEARRGQTMAAVVNFEQVLERNISKAASSEVNYHLGEAYVRMGRRQKAVEFFKTSASTAPYGPWAEQSAEYLKLLH